MQHRDIKALVMTVINAYTASVVYLYILTCNVSKVPAQKQKQKQTNKNRQQYPLWDYKPNTEPLLVHSSMHTVKIIHTNVLNIDI